MNRSTLACYALLASAFVLSAILFVQMQSKSILSEANASMVVNDAPVSAMTLRARNNDEVLCVLENNSQRLLIYNTDVARKQLRIVQNIDLGQYFRNLTPSGGGNSGRSSR
ncbi:MAG TPA: hypothetical protein DCM28_20625 [Phycisphaerales bacterium]|nr:hypothetical protein [Phycisphaerales bacterium]HCD35386.1 hypothetical protein [Phycisphaerales bacterium]|tara:strand:- start:1183 stop:1515 length:333 start_codon:yes stop_codon:yes gene_type:complete